MEGWSTIMGWVMEAFSVNIVKNKKAIYFRLFYHDSFHGSILSYEPNTGYYNN